MYLCVWCIDICECTYDICYACMSYIFTNFSMCAFVNEFTHGEVRTNAHMERIINIQKCMCEYEC